MPNSPRSSQCKRDALPTELTALPLENGAFPEVGAGVNPARKGTEREPAETSGPKSPEIVPKSETGSVYFIRAGRTNAVKIGWTKNEPEARLRELQCGSPHPLHLIGFLPGSMFDEADWHSRFADARIRGEWFTLTFRLRAAINELATTDCGFVQYLNFSLLTRGAA